MLHATKPTSDSLPEHQKTLWTGIALCSVSAASYSTLSILGKVAYQHGLTLPQMLGYRFGGAAVLLFAYLAIFQRRRLFPEFRSALFLFAIGAFVYASNAGLYFGALQRIPASLAGLLLFIYPLFVTLGEGIRKRRAPSRRQWAVMALALTGVVLTTGLDREAFVQAGRPLDLAGVIMALGAAVLYAAYILLTSRFIHRAGAWVGTAWLAAGAGLSFSALGWATGVMFDPLPPTAILIVLGLILISTILPLGTFLAGVERIGPSTASFISTLEPVFTVLLAFLILGESLNWVQGLGGVLVVVSALLLSLPGRARVPIAGPPDMLTSDSPQA
jgi:drug/metabolite transporter (DMT)-like permease